MPSALKFSWDPVKARSNRVKHGVSFEEASTVFNDPNAQFYADLAHANRLLAMGWSSKDRVLIVVHVDIMDTVRILSARKATAMERRSHEEGE